MKVIKKYNVNVVCRTTEHIQKSLINESPVLDIKVYKNLNGFTLTSNTNRISDGFGSSDTDSRPKKFYKDFVIKDEEGSSEEELLTEFKTNTKYKDNPKEFIRHYGSLLCDLETIQPKEKEFSLYSVKILDDRVITSLEDEYDAVSRNFTELGIILEKPKLLQKASELFTITKDKLASLKEGYYSIYPKSFLNKEKKVIIDDVLKFYTDSMYKFKSLNKMNVNGWIFNKTTINPNTNIEIYLSTSCLNDLNSKEDLSPDKEYIIYKSNKKLEPFCVISSDGEEPTEDVKKLFNSHKEFLRPYFYTSNKTTFSLNEEEFELDSKDFLKVKEDLISSGTPNYNFNF